MLYLQIIIVLNLWRVNLMSKASEFLNGTLGSTKKKVVESTDLQERTAQQDHAFF